MKTHRSSTIQLHMLAAIGSSKKYSRPEKGAPTRNFQQEYESLNDYQSHLRFFEIYESVGTVSLATFKAPYGTPGWGQSFRRELLQEFFLIARGLRRAQVSFNKAHAP